MALLVPEYVAYREVREVIVDHLAGEELPTGSPKRLRLQQLERELALELTAAEVLPADVERYYESQPAPRPLPAETDAAIDRAARRLLQRPRLRVVGDEVPPRLREQPGGMASEVSSPTRVQR